MSYYSIIYTLILERSDFLKIKCIALFFTIFLFANSSIYANNIDLEILKNAKEESDLKEENIYIENIYFKVINTSEDNLLPKNALKVISKQTEKQLDSTLWSSAVVLNSGNILLGKLQDDAYLYYELNKNGNLNFLIKLDYCIKGTTLNKKAFTIIKETEDNQIALGFLDTEFNIIYEPIFKYTEEIFEEDTEILALLDGKYGLFSIDGKTLVMPIFDFLEKEDDLLKAVYNNQEYTLERYNDIYINKTALQNIDTWALDEVLACIKLSIVPDNLQLKFKEYITREEFCTLLVNFYEIKTNSTIDITNLENPFIDTENEAVLKAYKLKIISGKTENEFDPYAYITREESAVMLYNLMSALGVFINKTDASVSFNDNKDISSWALDAVAIISSQNIMKGSDGYFYPKNNITTQEAIICLNRF